MPHLRLIGLVLFITAILLALAAAATKTTHIRIQTGAAAHNFLASPAGNQPQSDLTPDGFDFGQHSSATIEGPSPEFTSTPVVWPLLAAGATGLLLWFVAPHPLGRKQVGESRRRRR